MVFLLAASAASGCAASLSTARRHEIGGGVGFVGSDEPAQDAVWTMNDAAALTANYAFRVCDRCESFRLYMFGLWIVGPRPALSFPERRGPDCPKDCGDVALSYLFSAVHHF